MYYNQKNEGYGTFPKQANGLMTERLPQEEWQEAYGQEIPMMQEEMQREQMQQFIMQSLHKLRQMYPESNITSLEELAATPEGQQALEYWSKGIPLEQAYGAAFSHMIAENRSKAARQQAMNASNSKGHIAQPHGSSGGGSLMGAEDKAIWREFFPKATDAQLEAKWKKTR